jgi:hypothetical protein
VLALEIVAGHVVQKDRFPKTDLAARVQDLNSS